MKKMCPKQQFLAQPLGTDSKNMSLLTDSYTEMIKIRNLKTFIHNNCVIKIIHIFKFYKGLVAEVLVLWTYFNLYYCFQDT